MSGWVSSGRSGGWLAIFMGSVRRRQVTLSALLAGTVLAAGLIAIAPVIGFSLTVTFAVVLGVDLLLLRRRQIAATERSMAAAFRSRRSSRLSGDKHHRRSTLPSPARSRRSVDLPG